MVSFNASSSLRFCVALAAVGVLGGAPAWGQASPAAAACLTAVASDARVASEARPAVLFVASAFFRVSWRT